MEEKFTQGYKLALRDRRMNRLIAQYQDGRLAATFTQREINDLHDADLPPAELETLLWFGCNHGYLMRFGEKPIKYRWRNEHLKPEDRAVESAKAVPSVAAPTDGRKSVYEEQRRQRIIALLKLTQGQNFKSDVQKNYRTLCYPSPGAYQQALLIMAEKTGYFKSVYKGVWEWIPEKIPPDILVEVGIRFPTRTLPLVSIGSPEIPTPTTEVVDEGEIEAPAEPDPQPPPEVVPTPAVVAAPVVAIEHTTKAQPDLVARVERLEAEQALINQRLDALAQLAADACYQSHFAHLPSPARGELLDALAELVWKNKNKE